MHRNLFYKENGFDMAKWNLRSGRKATGGKYKKHGKKTRADRRRGFLPANVGEPRVKKNRTRGGGLKRILLSTNFANISTNGKNQKVKILSVAENPADLQFVRRNIMTKGAVIQTEIGKARVTSRPGQHGLINAVLIEEKSKKAE